MQSIIEIKELSRRFRRTRAIDNVSFDVAPGSVIGLVGENGAGKTTLIKHILGLLRAQTGSIEVFGMNPVTHPVKVLARIGYMSENRDLPRWMRVKELIRYMSALYPGWDAVYAERLREQFGLDATAKIRTLSLGQKAKTGLLAALAHRPELLVLDEPSSGLDPVVRRDILGAIFRGVAEEGRTVFFSSHLLDEVESVADRVVMMHAGKVLMNGALKAILGHHCKVVVRMKNEWDKPLGFPNVIGGGRNGTDYTLLCQSTDDAVRAAAASQPLEIVKLGRPSLDEIFVARVSLQDKARGASV